MVSTAEPWPATTMRPSACDRDPFAGVVGPAEVGGLPSVAAERRVERAVGEIAGQREVGSGAGRRRTISLAPATTILPSAPIATSLPESNPLKSVVSRPSPLNDGSSAPAAP